MITFNPLIRLRRRLGAASSVRILVVAMTCSFMGTNWAYPEDRDLGNDDRVDARITREEYAEAAARIDRAVGFELLSWFCFTTEREAKLAITGVELIGN